MMAILYRDIDMDKPLPQNISGIWLIEALARPIPEEFWSYADALDHDPELQAATRTDDLFKVQGNGVAVVDINGPIVKYDSFWARFFGFASTQRIESAIQQAAQNPDINSIMLAIDSPGGNVPGVNEVADTITQARKIKPVYAHISDLGASAAFWIASQAERITLNPTGEVGSIGVFALVPDTSQLYQENGINVHLITTGAYKGAGAPGVPITDDQIAYFQSRVNETFGSFQRAVRRGRKLSQEQLNQVNDGRVFGASDALNLKLIDRIRSFEGAISDASRLSSDQSRSARGKIADLRHSTESLSNIKLAEV